MPEAYRIYANDMMKAGYKGYIAQYDEELVRIKQINETFQLLATIPIPCGWTGEETPTIEARFGAEVIYGAEVPT